MLTLIQADLTTSTIYAWALDADAASAPESGAVLPGRATDAEIRRELESWPAPYVDDAGNPQGDWAGFRVERLDD